MTYKQKLAKWAARRAKIIRLSETMTQASIARKMGISRARVNNIVRSATTNHARGMA